MTIQDLKSEWESSQRSHSLIDLFRIFPEALTEPEKGYLKRKITINKIEIKQLTEYIEKRLKEINTIKNDILQFIMEEWLTITAGEATESLLKENKRISWLLIPEEKKSAAAITDQMIETAKEYPIENLIEVNRAGFALCAFHEEKRPSMYCKKNYYKCFACGVAGDSIALYQKLYNVNFIQAVKALQ